MKYTAQIISKGDASVLEKLMHTEQERGQGTRSSYTMTKKGENLHFDVQADDAVALRATLNSISKLLIVYEKMKTV